MLSEQFGQDWHEWPAEYQDPHFGDLLATTREQDRVDFFTWMQWLIDEQLDAAQSTARRAGMRAGSCTTSRSGCTPMALTLGPCRM